MMSHMDKLAGATRRGIAIRTGVTGILLGVLLTINAHGQTPSAPAAPPVPVETGYVIKFEVKPGKNAEFEKAISEMMIGVRTKEPGNVYCDLYHVPDDLLQTYVIVERYKDIKASKAHGDSAYIKKLGADLQNDVLDGPPDLKSLVFIRSK
ncbi:putative quinol monooxygenase [Granulicella arctica]|uniref:Quinol monooxygenase YgiN n=1 Tax=Granulicella arctica TaxID=940613 RepID=A0A7Y9TI43_9BACT|nr:antibiotic biosynthesis monooxygenase [Granulicella arctica]NYF80605.1 quinol monooxygenase YgiN [Granulicella arctica]